VFTQTSINEGFYSAMIADHKKNDSIAQKYKLAMIGKHKVFSFPLGFRQKVPCQFFILRLSPEYNVLLIPLPFVNLCILFGHYNTPLRA